MSQKKKPQRFVTMVLSTMYRAFAYRGVVSTCLIPCFEVAALRASFIVSNGGKFSSFNCLKIIAFLMTGE